MSRTPVRSALALVLLLALADGRLTGQVANHGNDFLNIGVGARWLALGGVGVAGGDDVEAAYWNPAGLNGMGAGYQLGAMHASYFKGLAAYNHLAFAHRLDSASAVAITAIRFGVDDIPNTTDLIDAHGNISYHRITLFSVADYALLLTYARALPIPSLTVGGSAKIIYRNVGKFASAWGFGVDVGAQYRLGRWRLGAHARDLTTTFNLWSFNAEELVITVGDSTFNQPPANSLELIPPQLILGAARTFTLSADFDLTAEANAAILFGGPRNTPLTTRLATLEPRLGLEMGFRRLVFLRVGANNMQTISHFDGRERFALQPNLGLGIRFRGISVHYALTNVGSVGVAGYSNIFSLQWAFGGER